MHSVRFVLKSDWINSPTLFLFRELKEPKGVQPAPAWIMTSGATPCWLCTCRSIWLSVKFGPLQGPSVCAQTNPPGSGQDRGKQVCYNHNTECVWHRNDTQTIWSVREMATKSLNCSNMILIMTKRLIHIHIKRLLLNSI